MKKVFITEEQFEQIINEMAYPASFSFDEFVSLSSYAKRIKYCNEKLRRISSGSSRVVYQVDDEKVLKIAKNQKGIAQNDAENDWVIQRSDSVAKVFETDKDGLYNEMELASKVSPSIFKSLVGFDFNKITDYLPYAVNKLIAGVRERYVMPTENEINFINNSEWLQNLTNLVAEMEMPMGDLFKLNSYGVVKRNGNPYVVLIDYGLTNQIYNDYYS